MLQIMHIRIERGFVERSDSSALMPFKCPIPGGLMAETCPTKHPNHSEKGPPDSSCGRNQFPGTIASTPS